MPSTRTNILTATDYYPFGMAIKSRSNALDASKLYTFGFGGQQKSTEINAQGNSYTAQFWQYDARTGRRLNLDPIDQFSISNYAAFRNNPIAFADPNGDNAIRDLYNTIAHNIQRGFQHLGHSMGLSNKPPIEGDEVVCFGKKPENSERRGIALTSEFNGGTDAKGIAEKTVNIDLIAVGAGAFNPGISSQFKSAWNYLVASAIKVVEAGYEALGIPDDVDAILPDNTPESQIKVQTSNDVAKRVSVDVIVSKIELARLPEPGVVYFLQPVHCTTRVSTADTNGMKLIRENDSTYFVPDNDLD